MRLHRIKQTIFLITFILVIFATDNICHAANPDIISQIVNSFAKKSESWSTIAKKYALILFYWCAILEVCWIGVQAALNTSEIREILKSFCLTMLTCGFFLAVINNYHEWSRQIINGMMNIAGEMGNVQNSSDNAFKMGLELCSHIWTTLKDMSFWDDAHIIIGMIISLFIVIICFCLITAQVILIKCEAYIAMIAACILVGFGATSFFREYAVNTLRYILSVAFKLFVMQLVIGIGYTFIRDSVAPKADMLTICITCGVAIVLLALVKSLPDVVAGIIQGSHVSTGNALTSTVSAVGSSMMGLGMAASSGMGNVGRAAQLAKAEGAQGVGGMLGATAKNLWNAGREASFEKDRRNGSTSSILRERILSAQSSNKRTG